MPFSDWIRYSLSVLHLIEYRVALQCALVSLVSEMTAVFSKCEEDFDKVLNG